MPISLSPESQDAKLTLSLLQTSIPKFKIEKEKYKTGRLSSLFSTYVNHPKLLGNPFLITHGTFVSYIWAPDFIQFSTIEYYCSHIYTSYLL